MNAYWFRPKTFGWGATPTTWEGWAVVVVYVAVVLAATLYLILYEKSKVLSVWWIATIVAATLIMTCVSWLKTDGDWRWRWGQTENSEKRS